MKKIIQGAIGGAVFAAVPGLAFGWVVDHPAGVGSAFAALGWMFGALVRLSMDED